MITGATGFIGQRLQDALLDGDYVPRAVIRPENASRHRLRPGCEALPIPLTDLRNLAEAVADARAVIYCAGSVRGRNADDFHTANVAGVECILAAVLQSDKPPPLLLISSMAATRPDLSHYCRTKHQGEQFLINAPQAPWTIFRPPAVYGPGDRELRTLLRLAAHGITFTFGSPNQRFSLLHVDDLAAAVIAWLRSWPACRNRVYSLDDGHAGGYDARALASAAGSEKNIRVRIPPLLLRGIAGINLLASAVLGYAPMLTPGKVRELCQDDWVCDNGPFTSATGWKPSVSLREGLRQATESGEPRVH